MVLSYALLLWPDRFLWFSERGVLSLAQSNAFYGPMASLPRLDVLAWTGDAGVTPLFVVLIGAAVLLTLGVWSRVAAFAVWACVMTLHNRTLPIHNSGDTIMQVMALYLVLSPCGAACSADRLRRILKGTEGDIPPLAPGWAQRLMQLQVATVYACTSLSKWFGDADTHWHLSRWRDGTAVWFPLHLPDSRRFPIPFVETYPHVMIPLLTYGTLAIETSLWTLVWFPRLRLYVLAAGVLLHLGIEYSLNIPLFSALMMASYLVFLRQSDLEHLVGWVQGNPSPSLPEAERVKESPNLTPLPLREGPGVGSSPQTWGAGGASLRVVYDGECDFCKSSLLIVHFLDALHLLTFVDYHNAGEMQIVPGVRFADAENAAIAVDRKDRQHAGFFAFRQIARRLPAVWPLAPLMYVPGVPWVGVRVYAWVAQNRSRLPVAPRFRVPRTPAHAQIWQE